MGRKGSVDWCQTSLPSRSINLPVYCLVAELEVYQSKSGCQKKLFTASPAVSRVEGTSALLWRFYKLFFFFFFICSLQFPRSLSAVWGLWLWVFVLCPSCQVQLPFPNMLTLCLPLIGFPDFAITTMHSHKSAWQITVLRTTVITNAQHIIKLTLRWKKQWESSDLELWNHSLLNRGWI